MKVGPPGLVPLASARVPSPHTVQRRAADCDIFGAIVHPRGGERPHCEAASRSHRRVAIRLREAARALVAAPGLGTFLARIEQRTREAAARLMR